MKYIKFFFLSSICIIFLSCGDDDSTKTVAEPPVELTENVEIYESSMIDNSYVMAIKNGGKEAFLVNKTGQKLHEWNFDTNLGNDLELLDNGKVLGMFRAPSPVFSFGGYGGKIRIINPDGSINWEMLYANENEIAHHDVDMLPNGNLLFLVWEKIDTATAQQNGINTTTNVYPEALVEINPATMQKVWEWHSKDHMVQDINPALPNYNSVSNNPQLINFNYNPREDGDIMHANGIDYDPAKNVVYVSVNFYSEVWVIDHSTTSTQAAGHTGGNYNKGGDLIYRFGNPEAYNNMAGPRRFYNNHYPNFLKEGIPGSGNLLIFNNGANISQSTVYELIMPEFHLQPNVNNEPQVAWSFTNSAMFYDRISGAVRLANGNTLICEGDYGFWEITPAGHTVWKYNAGTILWRGYNYAPNSQAIINLGL